MPTQLVFSETQNKAKIRWSNAAKYHTAKLSTPKLNLQFFISAKYWIDKYFWPS